MLIYLSNDEDEEYLKKYFAMNCKLKKLNE